MGIIKSKSLPHESDEDDEANEEILKRSILHYEQKHKDVEYEMVIDENTPKSPAKSSDEAYLCSFKVYDLSPQNLGSKSTMPSWAENQNEQQKGEKHERVIDFSIRN